MYGTSITLVGNIVDDVQLKTTATGLSRLQFRVANTERRKDPESGEWRDGHKLFLSVTFWRDFADNVAASMKKGDPIVLRGRLHSRQYIKDETNYVSYEIEPESIGHDLARGTAEFSKKRRGFATAVEVDGAGAPINLDDHSYRMDPTLHPETADVRELVAS